MLATQSATQDEIIGGLVRIHRLQVWSGLGLLLWFPFMALLLSVICCADGDPEQNAVLYPIYLAVWAGSSLSWSVVVWILGYLSVYASCPRCGRRFHLRSHWSRPRAPFNRVCRHCGLAISGPVSDAGERYWVRV